jgi:hypothetical protein
MPTTRSAAQEDIDSYLLRTYPMYFTGGNPVSYSPGYGP